MCIRDRVAVFVLLSIYISILSLTACSVMSYVRSLTVALDNKNMFADIRRLGAAKAYTERVLRIQLKKIYQMCIRDRAYTDHIDHSVDEVRGMLAAMKLDKKIRIAFDEWNLRSWHHPNVHTVRQGTGKAVSYTHLDVYKRKGFFILVLN